LLLCFLSRLKVQLSDTTLGTRSPIRHHKRNVNSNVSFSAIPWPLCGIGIEFEIMSVATDKASFRVIELQGQVVILRKCFHLLHLICILVHQVAPRTGWCCQFQGISLLLDPMYVNLWFLLYFTFGPESFSGSFMTSEQFWQMT